MAMKSRTFWAALLVLALCLASVSASETIPDLPPFPEQAPAPLKLSMTQDEQQKAIIASYLEWSGRVTIWRGQLSEWYKATAASTTKLGESLATQEKAQAVALAAKDQEIAYWRARAEKAEAGQWWAGILGGLAGYGLAQIK